MSVAERVGAASPEPSSPSPESDARQKRARMMAILETRQAAQEAGGERLEQVTSGTDRELFECLEENLGAVFSLEGQWVSINGPRENGSSNDSRAEDGQEGCLPDHKIPPGYYIIWAMGIERDTAPDGPTVVLGNLDPRHGSPTITYEVPVHTLMASSVKRIAAVDESLGSE